MLKAIVDNPYRILGVYSNAEDNEIMVAAEKLLSVPGAKCDTDFAIPGLPKPRRDFAAIESAKQKVLDLNEAPLYKMFWFMKSPDDAGLKELEEGDVFAAGNAWFRSFTEESKHNVLVGYLVEGNFPQIAYEAYDLLFKQDYRQEVLKTRKQYPELMDKFKAALFDDTNAASVPLGTGLSWKQYVQEKILTGISDTLRGSFIKRAKSQIDPDVASSYLSALSTMMTAWTNIRALREFANIGDRRYLAISQELVDTVHAWIESYLPKSQDILKYRAVQTYATAFSSYAPNSIQRSFLRLYAWNIQKAGELRITPEICDIANEVARQIYKLYQRGNVSSDEYRTLIERIAPSFVKIQKASIPEDSCYQFLANYVAEVGLKIIDNEAQKEPTEQIIADAGSVICYIDNVIDSKLLNEENQKNRNRCMNRLWNLGLGPVQNPRFPNAMRKMRWDSALFKDEETTFRYYCSSLRGCQSYLKRFPDGKYVKEVSELINKNDFKSPQKAGNSQSIASTFSTTPRPSDIPTSPRTVSTTNVNTVGNKPSITQTSSSPTKSDKPRSVKSVIIFICITIAIEVVCALLVDNALFLILGLLMAVGYWYYSLKNKRNSDKIVNVVQYIFIATQCAISFIGLLLALKDIPGNSDFSSLIVSTLVLGGSGIVMCVSIILRNYLERHPGPSKPANGRSPLFLGTGNGIGVLMAGDFDRKPINGQSVTVSYTFISLFIPIIPVGCYNSRISGFSRKSHKQSTTTYAISGSQPWRLAEILQIYFWWYSFIGLAIGLIGFVASIFGGNFF